MQAVDSGIHGRGSRVLERPHSTSIEVQSVGGGRAYVSWVVDAVELTREPVCYLTPTCVIVVRCSCAKLRDGVAYLFERFGCGRHGPRLSATATRRRSAAYVCSAGVVE